MKKTISLIIAITLSLSIFAADITGIAMIARAGDVEDYDDGDDGGQDYQEPWDQGGDDDGGDDDEEARRVAYEKAAREAEEAAAAEEAEKKAAAEAAAEAAAKAEEEARKAAEEAAKQAAQQYSLVASTPSVNFGSEQQGVQRGVISLLITNVGNVPVDLIFTETGDPDGAFSISLHGDNTHLEPGDTAGFNVSMSFELAVGSYSATVLFADASSDPGYSRALGVPLFGDVTPRKPVINNVIVTPSKATLAVGGGAQFTAEVDSNVDMLYTIRWSVAGNRSTGTYIDDSGYLTVADDETSSPLTVIATVKEDTSASGYSTVNLQNNSFNVVAKADPVAGGSVTGGGAVKQGGSVTLSAVPNKNYYFAGWELGGTTVSTATNYTINNVTSDMSLTARFGRNYVTVRADSNNDHAGTVVGGGKISYGGSTVLSAVANKGYVFVGWMEDGSCISRDATLKLNNITTDRRIIGVFDQTSHTLTLAADPKEGGTVSGGGTFDVGQGTTIKAVASAGYTFQGWKVNGHFVSHDAQYRINSVPQDFTCTAVFTKNGVTLYQMSSGVATTGGSITPCGKMSVAAGQNLTYTITPKTGFAILAVAVDGAQVGPVSTYTFTNIQSDHVIAAAFVQTDAGKQAAQQSGKLTQEEKVTVLPKTLNNTATQATTVDLEDAASGKAGDDYVEEMDLSDVQVPTDEQLGITPETDEAGDDETSDVIKQLGTSIGDVDNMIDNGNTMPILDAAYYTGGLGVYVYNLFEPEELKNTDYKSMTREELAFEAQDGLDPSIPDLDVVVQKMLSKDEITKLVKGSHVDISVSLTGLDGIDKESKQVMTKSVGNKPLKYFDLTMLKTVDGYTERVEQIPEPMMVVIEIPKEIYKAGKNYCILRVHNEELKVLPDLDDNPKTITFKTDCFSTYAISQEVASANSLIAWLVGGSVLALGVAITCFLILVAHQRKVRRMKRRAAHSMHQY